jgi:N-acyl-D-aspartate/D-glutamate deacylase
MKAMSPLDAAFDLLLAEIGQLHRPMVILHCYTEDLLKLAYQHRDCSVGSDATALAPDGPLAGSTFHGAYSWAAWFWRRIVRESGMLTREEGVRRMTSLAADRVGLKGRGVLQPGAAADIIVFDDAAFGETATTFDPNRLAKGMHHVVVNGIPSLRDGKLLSARSGAVLRKTG